LADLGALAVPEVSADLGALVVLGALADLETLAVPEVLAAQGALAVQEVLAVLAALADAAATTPCGEQAMETRRASRPVEAMQAASPCRTTVAVAHVLAGVAAALVRAVGVAERGAAEVVAVAAVAAVGVVDRRHP
jgi:hypothetical protein